MARNLNDMREIVRRELEKERIRQQIIAEEIVRRREFMMERQLALPRASAFGAGAVFPNADGFNPPPPLPNPVCGEPGVSSLGFSPLHSDKGEAAQMVHQVEPPSDFEASSEKVISWAKPDPNICNAKRKAKIPPSLKLYSANPLEKLSEERSCAICQFSASSEQGLKEHLRGGMHMAKAAELTQGTEKNSGGASAKDTTWPARNAEITPSTKMEKKAKASPHAKIARETSSKNQYKEDSEQIDGHTLKKKQFTGDANGQCGVVEKMQVRKGSKAANFEFWCEICQIGSHSEVVFGSHLNGKKHAARVKGVDTKTSRGRNHSKLIWKGGAVESA